MLAGSGLCWILALCCFLQLRPVAATYVLTVPPFEEECVVMRTPKSSTISGNFELMDDELPSDPVTVLLVDVTDVHDKVLYRSPRKRFHGHFNINVDGAKRLSLCVQNGIHWVQKRQRGRNKNNQNQDGRGDHIDGYNRMVGINTRVRLRDEVSEIHDQHDAIIENVEDLHDALADLVNHQEHMRTRESKHRAVVEATFTSLMKFTLLEAVALILVAFMQVWYFRRFLEQRRYM